jgi:hypothetical protein
VKINFYFGDNRMKKHILHALLVSLFILPVTLPQQAAAQPRGDFGFGLIALEPLGGTIKYWTAANQALDADIGESYFGAPRVDVDYCWHYNSFNSQVLLIYGGIGAAFGFGGSGYYDVYYGRDYNGHPFYIRDYYNSTFGFGARFLLGLDILPRRIPLEFFAQAGPLLGISPAFGVGFDFAIGVRFYP